MNGWITANEIINKYSITETNLISFVRHQKIKAYEKNSEKPVDIEEQEKLFVDIKTLLGIWIPGKRRKNFQQRNRLEAIRSYLQGDDNEINRIPWNTLYKTLYQFIVVDDSSNVNFNLKIPRSQFQELHDDWGNNQTRTVIIESLFKEEDIQKILRHFQTNEIGKSELKTSITNQPATRTAIDQLDFIDIEELWPEANRQQKEGFETFKKRLEKEFRTGIRAAVAVLAYCQQNGKKLKHEELLDLFDNPEASEGAEKIVQYKKISRALIQDIYSELPEQYRHKRGEKKP